MGTRKLVLAVILAVLIVATVLSACSTPAPTATPTPKPQPTAATSGSGPTAVPQPAGFDWKRFQGQEVYILLNKHPVAEMIIGLTPGFEEKTGIKVIYEVLSEVEYLEKQRLEMASGTGLYDVTMVSPSLHFRFGEAGWEEPLDQFLTAEWTDLEAWDVDDFYKSLLDANRWNLKVGCGKGEGSLYGIPVMFETYILPYRGDLLDKYKLSVPKTIEDLYTYATTIQAGERAAGNANFYGGVTRGHPTMAQGTGFASMSAAYAKEYENYDFAIDKASGTFKCVMNQPSLVDFTEKYVKIMKDAGPPGWNSIVWYDAMGLFSTGNYGFFTDCDFFAYTYEDPAKSQVAGKARYAILPAPVDGTPKSNVHAWSLGIVATSRRKGPAWYAIQYFSLPESLLEGTVKYNNYNPTRISVLEHPDVQATMGKWGQGTYLPTVNENVAKYAKLWYTPHRQQAQTNEVLVKAMHAIWLGGDAKQALDAAAASNDEIIRKAGIKPDPSCIQ